jgi:hypothetical protein
MAASNRMFPVSPKFDMQDMIEKVSQMYRAKGFMVTAMPMGDGASIDFRKDDGGIKKYIGMARGLKANIMMQNGNMIINFAEAEWTGKIIALTVGWFCCLVPGVLGIIGVIQQYSLPTEIGNDIQLIVGSQTPAGGGFVQN